jgi:hypothetical protein
MTWTITATYDGSKFVLDEPLPLEPGTRVLLTVHAVADERGSESFPPGSFLDVARSLKIDGPPDWSARVDHYLYGPMVGDDDDP